MPAARADRAMLPVSTSAARKTRCLAGVQCARTGGVCWVIRQDEADCARVGQGVAGRVGWILGGVWRGGIRQGGVLHLKTGFPVGLGRDSVAARSEE